MLSLRTEKHPNFWNIPEKKAFLFKAIFIVYIFLN